MKRVGLSVISTVLVLMILMASASCTLLKLKPITEATPETSSGISGDPASISTADATSDYTFAPTVAPTAVLTNAPTATPDPTPEPTQDPAELRAVYQVYKEAMDKTNLLDDIVQEGTVEQKLNLFIGIYGNQTSESKTTTYLECAGRHSGMPLVRMNVSKTSKSGTSSEKTDVDVYASDEKLFIKNNNATDYTVVSRDSTAFESLTTAIQEEKLVSVVLSETSFTRMSMKKNSSGETVINAVFKDDAFDKLFDGAAANLKASIDNMGAKNVLIFVDDLEVTYTISGEGYVLKTELKGTIHISFNYLSVYAFGSSDVSSVMVYTDPGKPVVITFPDGTKSDSQPDPESVYSVYKAAINKTKVMKEFDRRYIVDQDMKFDFGEGSIFNSTTHYEISMKCKGYGSDNVIAAVEEIEDKTEQGEKSNSRSETYIGSMNIYRKTDKAADYNVTPRIDFTKESIKEYIEENKPSYTTLKESAFAGTSFTANPDGTRTVTAISDSESVKDFVADFEKQLLDNYSASYDVKSLKISNPVITVTISDDGYLLKDVFSFDYTMECTLVGTPTVLTAKEVIIFEAIDPGKPVTIVFPAS